MLYIPNPKEFLQKIKFGRVSEQYRRYISGIFRNLSQTLYSTCYQSNAFVWRTIGFRESGISGLGWQVCLKVKIPLIQQQLSIFFLLVLCVSLVIAECWAAPPPPHFESGILVREFRF